MNLSRDTPRDRTPWWITLGLVVLLGILGALQYHWLAQVAEADRARSHAALDNAVERFAEDFNGELSRLLVALRGGRLGRQADQVDAAARSAWSDWKETAPFPELVRGIYVLASDGDVRPLDEGENEIPEELLDLRDRIFPRLHDDPSPGTGPPPFSILADEVPALVLPYLPGRRSGPRERARHEPRERPVPDREDRRRRRPRRPEALLVVHLDRAVILEDLFPALAERYFGEDFSFRLRVVDDGQTLFSWGPGTWGPGTWGPGTWGPDLAGGENDSSDVFDAEAELFGPLFRSSRRGSPRFERFLEGAGGLDEGRWRLRARHPSGSLDAALERVRRRNLAVAMGILAVLCAALVLLTRNAARSRRLARQQLDFVAGITHELMTPLAALRSAGQNLADGVVTEGPQVARYGRMIDREGRRLTDLVGQVLTFARMQSGARFELAPLDAAELTRHVVDELRPQLEAEKVSLHVEIEDPSPWVLADRQALGRALANLLGNGIKYGRPADPDGDHELRLRVRHRGTDVDFAVEDFGPGIPPAERTAIFEPFYRGDGQAASAVPGTGLGLALVEYLVEAQGGKVGLVSKVGHGSTFTLSLPSATPPDAREEPTP